MSETKKIESLVLPQGFTMYGDGLIYEQIKAEAAQSGIDAVRYEEVSINPNPSDIWTYFPAIFG